MPLYPIPHTVSVLSEWVSPIHLPTASGPIRESAASPGSPTGVGTPVVRQPAAAGLGGSGAHFIESIGDLLHLDIFRQLGCLLVGTNQHIDDACQQNDGRDKAYDVQHGVALRQSACE